MEIFNLFSFPQITQSTHIHDLEAKGSECDNIPFNSCEGYTLASQLHTERLLDGPHEPNYKVYCLGCGRITHFINHDRKTNVGG